MQLSNPVNGTIDRELNLSIIDISNFDTAPLFDSVSAMIPSNSTKELYLRFAYVEIINRDRLNILSIYSSK